MMFIISPSSKRNSESETFDEAFISSSSFVSSIKFLIELIFFSVSKIFVGLFNISFFVFFDKMLFKFRFELL